MLLQFVCKMFNFVQKTMEVSLTYNVHRYPIRLRKKISRSRAKLIKEGFECSDVPTQCLVIANGGLSNGVRRQDLEAVITNCKALQMSPQKSYATVTFEDAESALEVMENLQGYSLNSEANLASTCPVLYLHFVKAVLNEKTCAHSLDYRDVPGLILHQDFITPEEEVQLIEFLIEENPAAKTGSDFADNVLRHRLVWHYGYDFRYKYNDVDRSQPLESGIPDLIAMLIARMQDSELLHRNPDQITVNKYDPGQGIPPHIDNPEAFDETLASLSLNSQTVMDFRNVTTRVHVQVVLKPRSLVIFTGEARYSWTHGICPKKVDLLPVDGECETLTPVNRGTRFSITFRRVREEYQGPNL